jgi:hypothetical protein
MPHRQDSYHSCAAVAASGTSSFIALAYLRPQLFQVPTPHSLARPLIPSRSPPPNTSCPPPWPGHSHSFPDCSLVVCQCTRARSPPPRALFPPTLQCLRTGSKHENGKGISVDKLARKERGGGDRGETPLQFIRRSRLYTGNRSSKSNASPSLWRINRPSRI